MYSLFKFFINGIFMGDDFLMRFFFLFIIEFFIFIWVFGNYDKWVFIVLLIV